jgi:23S rRNA (cytosine1962-C5)-methyltransferase
LAKVLPDVTCHIVNADGPARHQEGLEADHRLLRGAAPSPCAVVENGVTYHIDPAGGQKTGWFFDHRRNRAFAAELAAGRSVLDLYSYAGGFGLLAAARGAASVLSVDRAQPALDLAASAAQAAGLNNWRSETAEVFAWLEGAAERFDLVIADPPAFAKAKKDIPTAVQGYKKLARLCAARVAPGGLLALASCSHHVDSAAFLDACASGIRAGGRGAALLHSAAAGPEHPVHPMLPQTGYLKFLLFGLD